MQKARALTYPRQLVQYLLIISIFWATPAMSAQENISSLTRQILSRELELEKLNTQFRICTSLVSPFRQRRMFLYAQSNACLTEASLIEQMRVRYQLAKDKVPKGSELNFDPDEGLPEQLSPQESASAESSAGLNGLKFQNDKPRQRLANAAKTQLTGQAIGGAGDLFEISLNFCNYLRIKQHRFTPGQYGRRVHDLHCQIDQLIEDRDKAISASDLPESWREMVGLESKLIWDFRDLSLLEYSDFHSAVKRLWVLQNIGYQVDLLKNSLSMTSNIIGLTGNHLHRPRMQGGAGIFSLLSGCVVLVTPLVGRVTGNIAGMAARRLASRELAQVAVSDVQIFSADRNRLLKLLQQRDLEIPIALLAEVRQNLEVYQNMGKLLEGTKFDQEAQRKRARDSLRENIVFAGLVGPPRIANGVNQVVAGWRHYTDPPLANKLYAGGVTAYAAGTAINIGETARLQADFELERWHQTRTHTTSLDKLKDRLKLIGQTDEALNLRGQVH